VLNAMEYGRRILWGVAEPPDREVNLQESIPGRHFLIWIQAGPGPMLQLSKNSNNSIYNLYTDLAQEINKF